MNPTAWCYGCRLLLAKLSGDSHARHVVYHEAGDHADDLRAIAEALTEIAAALLIGYGGTERAIGMAEAEIMLALEGELS